ncbi:MAG TPA: hypothetical protein VKQ36_16500, partial [Ktedonobacterales bacterium]|nr:hypothetical protein [Ktedonobacterales bacterium]
MNQQVKERIHANWALTGASRLVTLAPGDPENPLGVITQGALAARDGRIVWVGSEHALTDAIDLDAIPAARRFDARGRAVLPGFVDAHTHFIFAGDRAEEFHLRHAGVSYEELGRQGRGILSTVRATRAASSAELCALGMSRLRSFAAQ